MNVTAGATTINGTLNAGLGNVTLNTGVLNLNNDVSGATVTLDNRGLASGAGTINATTLVLEGTADENLNGDVANLSLLEGGGGNKAMDPNVTLNNGANPLSISGTIASGNLMVTAGATTFGTTSVGGNLSVTASGTITQTGGVTVSGITGLSAGANAITMNNSGNDFGGAIAVNNSGANDVSLNNGGFALTVNGVVGGNLSATGAGIGDGGAALTVGGTTSLTAGTGHAINFADAGDSFAGAVTIQSGDTDFGGHRCAGSQRNGNGQLDRDGSGHK